MEDCLRLSQCDAERNLGQVRNAHVVVSVKHFVNVYCKEHNEFRNETGRDNISHGTAGEREKK